jgi:hypothetical protein
MWLRPIRNRPILDPINYPNSSGQRGFGQPRGLSPETLSLDCFLMSKRWNFPWRGGPDGGGDSLDLVELVMELEEEFDITIPDEEAARIKSVDDARRCLEQRRRENGK